MIDANSRTNRFLEAIEKYAEQQRNEMRAEVEAFREEQLAAANEEGTAAAFAFIQEQKSDFKAALAKEAALKETQKKRELFEKRNQMAESVFEAAAKKLTDFTKTSKYKEYITTSARLISEKLDGKKASVHISERDQKYSSMIKSIIPGCEIVSDSEIKLGGISCYCDDMSIIIDDTLDTKLEDRKRLFVATSGLTVE